MQYAVLLYGRVAQWQSMGLQILRSPVRLRSRPLFFILALDIPGVAQCDIHHCRRVRGLVVTIPASGAGGRGFDSRRTPFLGRDVDG